MSAETERAERRALLALALASVEKEDDVRAAFRTHKGSEPPTVTEALGTLKDLTVKGQRKSHRVLYLDLLTKVAHRRGAKRLDAEKVALYDFVELAVVEGAATKFGKTLKTTSDDDVTGNEMPKPAAIDHLSDQTSVNKTIEALYGVQQGIIPQDQHRWTAFATAAQPHLSLSPAEIHRPLCIDDSPVVMPNNETAIRTAVWLWSREPASKFARWTDPRLWAKDCSLFFKSVELKKGQTVPANAEEFSATFTEKVCVDGDTTLDTDLVFSRYVQGTDLYALEFVLPAPTADILVDAGQVTVRHDPEAPPSRRTSLLAEKYILFNDPAFRDWPTVACDLFWTEFAIVMALGCSKDQ